MTHSLEVHRGSEVTRTPLMRNPGVYTNPSVGGMSYIVETLQPDGTTHPAVFFQKNHTTVTMNGKDCPSPLFLKPGQTCILKPNNPQDTDITELHISCPAQVKLPPSEKKKQLY